MAKTKNNPIPESIRKVDKKINKIVKGFEILSYVNPINLEYEKKEFYRKKYNLNPTFKYKEIGIDLAKFKRNLLDIQTEQIEDVEIRALFEDTIESYFVKADMLAHLNTRKFIYNSLKYFGQPSGLDTKQANFLLMCPNFIEQDDELIYDAQKAKEVFEQGKLNYNLDIKIEIKPEMVSRALASNTKKTVFINKNSMFSKRDIDGLIEHEIGIHLLTYFNAKQQPLRIFQYGLPLNTKTQEGLAVVSEYLSNNINLNRLRELGLRVIAINSLIEGNDFKTTFAILKEQYKLTEDKAYYLTSRVYRGGGFTKDYLYIRGLRMILKKLKTNTDITNLFIGKTSYEYLDTLNKMVELNYALPPTHLNFSFENHKVESKTHPILRYILEGLVY
jgi:uncharacterized protein (TIGR02421 family)